MLGKLLKYDLKWIYKVVVVFYVLSLIFSCIGRALSYIENSVIFSIVSQFSLGIAVAMMISSLINCVLRLWVRFIKNIYKDESYLTHTLPIEKKTIYTSKIISALISVITTGVIIIISLFICFYSEGNIEALKSILEIAASSYNTTVMNLVLLIALVLIMQVIFIVMVGYTAIILGHKSNKNKMVKTLVIGFGLYFLTQILSLAVIFIFGLLNPDIMNLINTTSEINVGILKVLMYLAIGIYVVYNAFYYILGKKQFEKGVNVE